MRILVAEDERDLNRVICKQLARLGWQAESVYDGAEALAYLDAGEYDAVIMDVMMPVMDGFETVRRLRARGILTPVLFLTARGAIEDRVTGLDLGADDYMVKPFAFDELLARLRVMTRKQAGNPGNVYTVADLSVDVRTGTATRGGIALDLSAKEYAMLEYLIRNRGVILTREQIESNVWGFDYEGGSNVVDVYIGYLRRKIDKNSDVKLLHTVRGRGYVLKAQEER